MEQTTDWTATWQKLESGANHVAENKGFTGDGAGTYRYPFRTAIYRLADL